MRDLVAEIEAREIRARIKKARKEAGLTQQQLAELLEVIPRSVQNYESEKQGRVPWGKINAIAKITGKTPEWLLHGEAPDPFAGRPAANQDGPDRLTHIEELLGAIATAVSELGTAQERLERTMLEAGRAQQSQATGRKRAQK